MDDAIVKEDKQHLLTRSRGELINIRASAGARMVEAREALGRTSKARAEDYERARIKLLAAEQTYALALQTELDAADG